jgi:hypothetical protein
MSNLAQIGAIPGPAVKKAALSAITAAVAVVESLDHWCVDDLMSDDLIKLDGGVWLHGKGAVRLPPGSLSTILIKPPAKASKLVFTYLDSKCADEMSLEVAFGGGGFAAVGFNRVDGFGRPDYWTSDLMTTGTAAKVQLKVAYKKAASEDHDYFLGYGLAWS